MNAWKDLKEGLLTDAEYNSIRSQEAFEYEEEMRTKWSDEEVFEDDEIDEF